VVNVLLVEDLKITRDMIESYIARSPGYALIASLENAANAEVVCMNGKVDLVLMDVCTADDESGLVAAAKIKKNDPKIRVIIMTSMPEHSFIQKAKDAGCDSFWYKEYGNVDLIDLMDQTMQGQSVFPDDVPVISVGLADSKELTERELEVMRQLALGYKYDEIAVNLNLSVNTVKYHIKNLLIKTGYRSTLQLVVDVVSKRLILPKY